MVESILSSRSLAYLQSHPLTSSGSYLLLFLRPAPESIVADFRRELGGALLPCTEVNLAGIGNNLAPITYHGFLFRHTSQHSSRL